MLMKSGLPFMDRKTTVFVDIARANPKSQSCNEKADKWLRHLANKKTSHVI